MNATESLDANINDYKTICIIVEQDEGGYGITISGDCPVYIQSIRENSSSFKAGVKIGDIILKVNGQTVTNMSHNQVVDKIKSCKFVALTIARKIPKPIIQPENFIQKSVEIMNKNNQNNNEESQNSKQPTYEIPMAKARPKILLTHSTSFNNEPKYTEMLDDGNKKIIRRFSATDLKNFPQSVNYSEIHSHCSEIKSLERSIQQEKEFIQRKKIELENNDDHSLKTQLDHSLNRLIALQNKLEVLTYNYQYPDYHLELLNQIKDPIEMNNQKDKKAAMKFGFKMFKFQHSQEKVEKKGFARLSDSAGICQSDPDLKKKQDLLESCHSLVERESTDSEPSESELNYDLNDIFPDLYKCLSLLLNSLNNESYFFTLLWLMIQSFENRKIGENYQLYSLISILFFNGGVSKISLNKLPFDIQNEFLETNTKINNEMKINNENQCKAAIADQINTFTTNIKSVTISSMEKILNENRNINKIWKNPVDSDFAVLKVVKNIINCLNIKFNNDCFTLKVNENIANNSFVGLKSKTLIDFKFVLKYVILYYVRTLPKCLLNEKIISLFEINKNMNNDIEKDLFEFNSKLKLLLDSDLPKNEKYKSFHNDHERSQQDSRPKLKHSKKHINRLSIINDKKLDSDSDVERKTSQTRISRSETLKTENSNSILGGLNFRRYINSSSATVNQTVSNIQSNSQTANRCQSPRTRSQEHTNLFHEFQNDSDFEQCNISLFDNVPFKIQKKFKSKDIKRLEVISELINTESSYVRNLSLIGAIFYNPLIDEDILPKETVQNLFPNIETLYLMHKSFLNDLLSFSRESMSEFHIGDILHKRFCGVEGESLMMCSTQYCCAQVKYLDQFKQKIKKDHKLSQFMQNAETNVLLKRLHFNDLVACVQQRITKYRLLFDQIIKYTPQSHPDHESLEFSLISASSIVTYVNQALKDVQNHMRLEEIELKIDKQWLKDEKKDFVLTNEELIKDGSLILKMKIGKSIDIHGVLTKNFLVLLTKNDDKLLYKPINILSTLPNSISKTQQVSPMFKLSKVIAIRDVAYDKKSFFLVYNFNNQPNIFELSATEINEQKNWVININEQLKIISLDKNIDSTNLSNKASSIDINNETIEFKMNTKTLEVTSIPTTVSSSRDSMNLTNQSAMDEQAKLDNSSSDYYNIDDKNSTNEIVASAPICLLTIESEERTLNSTQLSSINNLNEQSKLIPFNDSIIQLELKAIELKHLFDNEIAQYESSLDVVDQSYLVEIHSLISNLNTKIECLKKER